MQREIDQRNANVLNQDNFIKFRIGISTGEVTIDEHGDVFGDAVNIAARIQKFAEPHDVYISEATYLAMNKSEIKERNFSIFYFYAIPEGTLRSSEIVLVPSGVGE